MRFKRVLFAIAVIFASSAVWVEASRAMAAEFEFSKETGTVEVHGGVWNGSTKKYDTQEQLFKIEYETGKKIAIECEAITGKGAIAKAKDEALDLGVVYQQCEIAGVAANNFEVDYELYADGVFVPLNEITVKAKNNTCTVTVEPLDELGPGTYAELVGPEGNTSLGLEVKAIDIEWSATGTLAACDGTGSEVGAGKLASYTGNLTAWMVGGTTKLLGGGGPLFELKNVSGGLKTPRTVGEKQTMEVINIGTAAGVPAGLPEAATKAGFFGVKVAEIGTCRTMNYAIGTKCAFEVEVEKVTSAGETAVKWSALVTPNNGKGRQSLTV